MKFWAAGLAMAMSAFALSVQAEIRPIPKTITHTSSVSAYKDVEMKAEIWDVEEKMVQEVATWREYQCDYIPPEGSGTWYGFYELPLADKPLALDQAIEGLGLSDAKSIVYSREGFFAVRPRHWNAFKDEIARIENVLGLHGLYWNVVYTNGDRNARNLGYTWSRYGMATPSVLPEGANALASAPQGASDPWHGFFQLPKGDKPQALVDSIVGLDLSTAERIVDGGYFEKQPTDWKAFKAEIKSIESGLYLTDFYDKIVARNGSQNKRNLFGGSSSEGSNGGDYNGGDYNDGGSSGGGNGGDYNDGGSSGGGNGGDYNNPAPTPPPSAPSYDCGYVDQYKLVWRLKKVERLIDTLVKRVDISFDGGVLLSGETEYVTARWDGKSETISIDASSAINRYGITSDSRGAVYRLKSEGRRPINPSASDFGFSFSVAGGKLVLNITDRRNEELTKLSNGTYGVSVSFKVVKKGGTCSSNKTVATVTSTAVGSTGSVDATSLLAEAAATGDQFRVEGVTVERTGTEYFSGSVELGASDFYKY